MHFSNAAKKVETYHPNFEGFNKVTQAIDALEESAKKLTEGMESFLKKKSFAKQKIKRINKQLIALEKSFISEKGMYFGSWYRFIICCFRSLQWIWGMDITRC